MSFNFQSVSIDRRLFISPVLCYLMVVFVHKKADLPSKFDCKSGLNKFFYGTVHCWTQLGRQMPASIHFHCKWAKPIEDWNWAENLADLLCRNTFAIQKVFLAVESKNFNFRIGRDQLKGNRQSNKTYFMSNNINKKNYNFFNMILILSQQPETIQLFILFGWVNI